MGPVVLPTNLSRGAPDALEAAGSLMVVSFQVAISIGAVLGGYIVDSYGATAPLVLTAVLAGLTVALALSQRADDQRHSGAYQPPECPLPHAARAA